MTNIFHHIFQISVLKNELKAKTASEKEAKDNLCRIEKVINARETEKEKMYNETREDKAKMRSDFQIEKEKLIEAFKAEKQEMLKEFEAEKVEMCKKWKDVLDRYD